MLSKFFKFSALTLFLFLFLYIAYLHSNSFNTNYDFPDQKPYIDAAIKIKTENFWYMGDRNRMPIYSHIMSLFYSPNTDINKFFIFGKSINIFLTLVCVFIIYKIGSKYLSMLSAITFTAVVTFALFVLKAGYFQAENLFYTLFFISFLAFINAIRKPSVKSGLVVGITVAFAYLTKATILLGFLFYLVFFTMLAISGQLKKQKKETTKILKTATTSVLVFLVIVSPYIIQNKKIFGKYFYNVNTTFYIWYDSIYDAYDDMGTATHGDTIGWPDVAPEKIPSFKNYMSKHETGQVVKRFMYGFLKMLLFLIWSYAVIPLSFVCLYFFFLTFFIYLNRKKTKVFIITHKKIIIFIFLFWIVHIAAFSWYAIVDSGPRFILSLFIPFLFLASVFLERVKREKEVYLFYFNIFILIILFLSLKISVIPIVKKVYIGF